MKNERPIDITDQSMIYVTVDQSKESAMLGLAASAWTSGNKRSGAETVLSQRGSATAEMNP